MNATPELTERLVSLLHDFRALRRMQTLYRQTIDPVIRREMERFEFVVDARMGQLAADLAAVAEDAEAEVIAEGGAK